MAKKEEKNIKDKTSFMKSFKAELKKVSWPTPKQLFNNTVAVLAIVLITSVIVFVLDFAFESMNKYGINKVKQVVTNSSSNNVEENEEAQEDSSEDETISDEIVDETTVDETDELTDNTTDDIIIENDNVE
jgi:preprotein translocase subunit SecE